MLTRRSADHRSAPHFCLRHRRKLLPLGAKIVVRIEAEAEIVALLHLAREQQIPVTFRAAGTSLSGQAISDSVLVIL